MTQEKAKEVGLEETPFHIKITVPSLRLEIDVVSIGRLDCVILAGQIGAILRSSEPVKIQGWDKEPTVVILP
jgi:hypothetical protein